MAHVSLLKERDPGLMMCLCAGEQEYKQPHMSRLNSSENLSNRQKGLSSYVCYLKRSYTSRKRKLRPIFNNKRMEMFLTVTTKRIIVGDITGNHNLEWVDVQG